MAGLFEAAVEWIKEKTNPIPVIEITKKMVGSQTASMPMSVQAFIML